MGPQVDDKSGKCPWHLDNIWRINRAQEVSDLECEELAGLLRGPLH